MEEPENDIAEHDSDTEMNGNSHDILNGSDRVPVMCEDGSETLMSVTFGETYHSTEGSVKESYHVYIMNGLETFLNGKGKGKLHVNILEAGLGSGLDVLLAALRNRLPDMASTETKYTALELYPLGEEEWNMFDFSTEACRLFPGAASEKETAEIFRAIHTGPWNQEYRIDDRFTLLKKRADIADPSSYRIAVPQNRYDVCFFDAFSPASQPELWSKDVFTAIRHAMNPGGILATYSSKGTVKENLRASGFTVKRLKGFGNKRHMVTACIPESTETATGT